MQKLFNKILIPFDFSRKSIIAADEAIDVAKQYNCSIYLVHVVPVPAFSTVTMPGGHLAIPYNITDNKKELEFRLKRVADSISHQAGPSVQIDYSVLYGTLDHVIIDLVKTENFDLVLFGQKGRSNGKRKMVINPDAVASKTNIPVITVPSNRRLTNLYSIIIPITDFLPVRKLMYGIYIASKFTTTVKLLGVENRATKDRVQFYLKKSYQLIRDNSAINVEMDTITGENVAEVVNQFAIRTSADLVIVNPGAQTKMPGFFSTWLGNILQKFSAPPVLTVNPV